MSAYDEHVLASTARLRAAVLAAVVAEVDLRRARKRHCEAVAERRRCRKELNDLLLGKLDIAQIPLGLHREPQAESELHSRSDGILATTTGHTSATMASAACVPWFGPVTKVLSE